MNGWPSNLTAPQRILLAEQKIDALVDRVNVAFKTRASNKYMKFPGQPSPPSEASTMYNYIFAAMLKFEALELSSIWDRASPERNSIPTIISLLDHKAVMEALYRKVGQEYTDKNQHTQLSTNITNRRDQLDSQFKAFWQEAMSVGKELPNTSKFELLRNFRDFEIAHSIYKEGKVIDRNRIYLADPFWDQTVECVNKLYYLIHSCQRSFDFTGSQSFAEKIAKSWWEGLRLQNDIQSQ